MRQLAVANGPNIFQMLLVHSINSFVVNVIFIDRVAGAIIRLVASVCVSVRLSVGALLFEPFDL